MLESPLFQHCNVEVCALSIVVQLKTILTSASNAPGDKCMGTRSPFDKSFRHWKKGTVLQCGFQVEEPNDNAQFSRSVSLTADLNRALAAKTKQQIMRNRYFVGKNSGDESRLGARLAEVERICQM